MAAHTPGSWRWEGISKSFRDDAANVLAPTIHRYDSLAPSVIEYAGCGTHQIELTDEDAALIASAPDLLAACKELTASPEAPSRDILERALAAIAKAEAK